MINNIEVTNELTAQRKKIMDTSITGTLDVDEPIEMEQQPKQPAIKKGWLRAIIGTIVIAIASGLGTIPLLISGMITPVMAAMSASDLFNTVGVNTMLVFMLLQFIPALLAIFVFRKYVDRKTFKSLVLSFQATKET